MELAKSSRGSLAPTSQIQRGHLFQALLASASWSPLEGFRPRIEQPRPSWFSRLFTRNLDVEALDPNSQLLLVCAVGHAKRQGHDVITLEHIVLAALEDKLLSALISADGGKREALHAEACNRLLSVSAKSAAPYLSSSVLDVIKGAGKIRDRTAPGTLVQVPHIFQASLRAVNGRRLRDFRPALRRSFSASSDVDSPADGNRASSRMRRVGEIDLVTNGQPTAARDATVLSGRRITRHPIPTRPVLGEEPKAPITESWRGR